MIDDVDALLDRVPGWSGRARVERALDGGITNRNLLVTVGAEQFVLRLAGKDTDLLGIDRGVERVANEQAARLGVAPEVVAFLEPEGYLVTRFVTGSPLGVAEITAPDTVGTVGRMLRRFHDSGRLPGLFECFRIPERNARAARERGVDVPRAYADASARSVEIEAVFTASPDAPVPCHNDLLLANFLRDGRDPSRLWLLDWEYAGMNERWFDLGNFATNNALDSDAEAELLRSYEGSVTARSLARVRLMRVVSDLREAMWGVVQQGISTLDFDYRAYAEQHFVRVSRAVSDPSYAVALADAAAPETHRA